MNSILKSAWPRAAGAALLAVLVTTSARAAEMVGVTLGTLPIVSQAPVFIAQERGIFKDEGLVVTTHMFQGGPEITAAVISGDIDFGYAATVSPIIAYTQGAPIRIIAPSDMAGKVPANYVNVILTRPDTGITRFRDLEGRRVAVNQLKALLELLVRADVDGAGGDSSKITFVEAPFPQMRNLLATKQVDAAVNVEPFITQMVEAGDKIVANAAEVIEGGPLGIWFASERKSKDRALLKRFRQAMEKANAYASTHPEDVRKVIPTFTRIGADVAARIALPVWNETLDAAQVQVQADLLAKYKFINGKVDVRKIIVK